MMYSEKMYPKINYVLKKYPKIDLQFSIKAAAHLPFGRTKSDMDMLKRFYKEAPSSGPDAKKVKFSEVKDNITHHCPLTSVSAKMISSAIGEEFPNTNSVKLGKQ